MDTAIYDKLKEKIGEEKIEIDGEEKSLLAVVADWEEGLTKVKNANADLISQREAWETERNEMKENLGALETAKNELQAALDDATKKTGKKSAETQELEKQMNALQDKLDTALKQYDDAQKRSEQLEAARKESDRKSATESLRNRILTELGKHNIIGAQADIAWDTISAKGLARIGEDEEKGFIETFTTRKDGKELAATLSSMCEHFANENKFLQTSSGNAGSGKEHTPEKSGGAGRPTGLDMLRMED